MLIRSLVAGLIAGFLFIGPAAFAQPQMVRQPFSFIAKSATGNLSLEEVSSVTIFTNTGATSAIVLKLPDCSADSRGAVVRVLLTVAQTVDLDPIDNVDRIVFPGLSPDPGDAIRIAAVIGNTVSLVCSPTANTWISLGGSVGTITDVN